MKVLIVCDNFPPAFGPRMGYLCKYLSRKGITVDVLCEYVPDKRFEALCGYANRVKYVDFYKYREGWKSKWEWGTVMLKDQLYHYKDRRLIREVAKDPESKGYDLVLCSTYKTFPLFAAYKLAKRFKVPFVADLRDIAEQFPDKSYLNRKLHIGKSLGFVVDRIFTQRRIRQRNRMLRRADAVVSVSPWHIEFLRQINPNTHLIYNGYDPELFFPKKVRDEAFRISFAGRILGLEMRDPSLLFEAVAALAKRGVIEPEHFRLEWYVDEEGCRILEKEAARYAIEPFMHYEGFVPAAEIPSVFNRSSILLQLANKAGENGPKGIMTTKIFESLAVGKPLLLVRSDESYLEALVNRYRCGLAAREKKEIEAFIEEQYALWRKNGHTEIPVDPDIERQFSRERQAEAFLALFRNCLENKDFPKIDGLFLQKWWWQALCPEKDLRILRTEEQGCLTGFWPLARRKRLKGLFHIYAAPVLTQHTGPLFLERKYFKNLLLQIPSKAMLCVNVGWELNEEERALCRERGIECRNRVTHRIEDVSDLEKVWAGMTPARQRQIKKGMKHLHRVENPSVEMLLELQKETFGRRKLSLPYSSTAVRWLYNAVKEHGAGELVALADAENRIMACGLFVYDGKTCYSLMHGFRKTDKDWGAGSLLQWEGIRIASSRGLVFDFEGSNIETIAKFNLSFGAKPFTYTCLERYRRLFRRMNRGKKNG